MVLSCLLTTACASPSPTEAVPSETAPLVSATRLVCRVSGYDHTLSDEPVYSEDLAFPLDPASGVGDVQDLEFHGIQTMIVYQLMGGESEIYIYTSGQESDMVHSASTHQTREQIEPGTELVTASAEHQVVPGADWSVAVVCSAE